MSLILISIIVAAVISALLFRFCGAGDSGLHFSAGALGLLLAVAAGICAITYMFVGWAWLSAEHKATIINREYGTAYTQEEIFYAESVIDTIRQLDRKRYEVNGDLFREEEQRP